MRKKVASLFVIMAFLISFVAPLALVQPAYADAIDDAAVRLGEYYIYLDANDKADINAAKTQLQTLAADPCNPAWDNVVNVLMTPQVIAKFPGADNAEKRANARTAMINFAVGVGNLSYSSDPAVLETDMRNFKTQFTPDFKRLFGNDISMQELYDLFIEGRNQLPGVVQGSAAYENALAFGDANTLITTMPQVTKDALGLAIAQPAFATFSGRLSALGLSVQDLIDLQVAESGIVDTGNRGELALAKAIIRYYSELYDITGGGNVHIPKDVNGNITINKSTDDPDSTYELRILGVAAARFVNWDNSNAAVLALTTPAPGNPILDFLAGGTSVVTAYRGAAGATAANDWMLRFTVNVLGITTTSPLPTGTVGTAYNQAFAAAGGTAPYAFTQVGGTLPPGLNVAGGALAGIPTTAGTYTFDVQLIDAAATTAQKTFTVIINPAGGGGGGGGGGVVGLAISTTSPLTAGKVDVAYSQTFNATGGTSPYTFKQISGTLPDGLTFDGAAGVLSGTPTKDGTFTFTIQVKDQQSSTAQKAFSLTINPAGAVVSGFPDCKGHWAESYINEIIELGIMVGYPDGSFRPDRIVTRAEYTVMIVNAFKLPLKSGRVWDDTANHWAKDYISTAAGAGYVVGYNDSSFGPDDPITREQMAAILAYALGLTDASNAKTFADAAGISPWAKPFVDLVSGAGILNGDPDHNFRPLDNSTRAEAAVGILQALKYKS